jgi:hypothetical protein
MDAKAIGALNELSEPVSATPGRPLASSFPLSFDFSGAPCRNRTCDLPLRRRLLYPLS